jgi:hypothetical protein
MVTHRSLAVCTPPRRDEAASRGAEHGDLESAHRAEPRRRRPGRSVCTRCLESVSTLRDASSHRPPTRRPAVFPDG